MTYIFLWGLPGFVGPPQYGVTWTPSTKNRGVHPQNVIQNIILKKFVSLKKR